eukprot:NODE_427_length_8836_cov_0.452215.p7 type:complete len:121 gc:universal NODE_427_length_8836_cov_0.452215:6968-6606(-)
MEQQIYNLSDDGKYKPSTRVIVPGCQGGISQIKFGDDNVDNLENKAELDSRNFKPSTRVIVPGCQGGVSQIKFGLEDDDDSTAKKSVAHNPISGNPQVNAYKPSTRVTQQPGGNSSIRFG